MFQNVFSAQMSIAACTKDKDKIINKRSSSKEGFDRPVRIRRDNSSLAMGLPNIVEDEPTSLVLKWGYRKHAKSML